jgi:hypothetical protein
MPIYLQLFRKRRLHLLLKVLYFVDNDSYSEGTCSSKRLYKLKPILDCLNAKFRDVYTPECDVSLDELCGRDVCHGRYTYMPSKCAIFV